MITLEEVQKQTESIFEPNDLKIPEPPVTWKDKLIALNEANLLKQKAALLLDMRKWQANQMGFKEIETNDLPKMLMGKDFTEQGELPDSERQAYEWSYNHHTDQILEKWGGNPTQWHRKVKVGPWFLPPFSKKLIWTVRMGKLDYLKREIPYGVILKINECKKIKLFNCFNVIAPLEAWQQKTTIDPIVVATIWELPPNDQGEFKMAGNSAHFFLAQWK
jgi:hypothetical protein